MLVDLLIILQILLNAVVRLLLTTLNCISASVFMVSLFVSHIRPIMDFCSSVWNVGYLGDIRLLESVQ